MSKENTIVIKQESRLITYSHKLKNAAFWKTIVFSNIFQLLPIWIMFIIQLVSEYTFNIREYICNFLTFVIIACTVNLADFLQKTETKSNKISRIFVISLLMLVLCFALTIYCLQLLCDFIKFKISETKICAFAVIFLIIIILINIWKEVKNQGVEDK